MWIAEFARRAGVKQTTVRHYLRQGLLSPGTGPSGGSRPYLEFTEADLRLLSAIQAGQALGLSLMEIKQLIGERRSGRGHAQMLKTLTAQRETLRGRAQELQAMLRFIERKIAWIENGAKGPPPSHAVTPRR
jgi:DNA-binding transcriptional MerR regulator